MSQYGTSPWNGGGGFVGIPQGFELPAWAGGNLQTFLNSANPQSFPQIYSGPNAVAEPGDLRETPNPNQNPLDWMNEYRDLRTPGWDQRLAANPQWGNSPFFDPKKGFTNNQAKFMEDLFLGYDLPRIQGAADRQFTRVNEAIGRHREGIDNSVENIRAAGIEGADSLRRFAQEAGQEAMRFGHGAVEDAREGVRRADELAGTGTQSAVAGYERNVRNQLALMRSGTNPDGSPMTAEQYAAVQQQVMYDTSATASSIRSDYERNALQMRQNLSQMQLGAGGLSANVDQIAGNLRTQAEHLNTSVQLAAAQLEAQGRREEAGLLMANPESVVSISNALLNMWGVFMGGAPTPGAGGAGSALQTIAPIAGAVIGSIFAPGAGTAAGAAIGGGVGQVAGGGGGFNSGGSSTSTFMNFGN